MSETSPIQFKYESDIGKINECPPLDLKNDITIGFRFAFANIGDDRNMLPVAKITPSRHLSGGQLVTACCEAHGLSMFSSLEQLQNKANSALKTSPQFLKKKVGEFYTQLNLLPESGKHNEPNPYGHFTFFESVKFHYLSAVIQHEKLDL